MNTGELVVIVEEQYNHGQQFVARITEPVTDLDAAAGRAYELATKHRPDNPTMPQERTVYRRSDGSWLVGVKGMTSTHYFTVSVLEVEGVYPDEYK